jgi:hypothetical protein
VKGDRQAEAESMKANTVNNADVKQHSRESLNNINQDMDQQQLSRMVQEKLDSAQNSNVKRKEDEDATSDFRRQSSFISSGSTHSQRMADHTLDHPKALS